MPRGKEEEKASARTNNSHSISTTQADRTRLSAVKSTLAHQLFKMPPKTRKSAGGGGGGGGNKEDAASHSSSKAGKKRPSYEEILASTKKKSNCKMDKSYEPRKTSETRITEGGARVYLRHIVMYK